MFNYQLAYSRNHILFFTLLLISISLLSLDIEMLQIGYPYEYLQNYAHVIIFIIIISAIYKILPKNKPKLILATIIAVVLAFLTEIFQFFTSRDADIFDLMLNFSGIGIAVCWILLKHTSQRINLTFIRICLFSLSFITLSTFLYQTITLFYAEYRYNKMLPTLASFENEWELERWYHKGTEEFKLSHDFSTFGNSSIKVEFHKSSYPRFGLLRIPEDWSKFQYFSFDVLNPDTTIMDLNLRFDDTLSENYATRGRALLKIHPGKNKIEIPLMDIEQSPPKRFLNMKNMQKIVIFLNKPSEKCTLFFDYFRLE
jgi:glycopeptide antibiotics resistance protein